MIGIILGYNENLPDKDIFAFLTEDELTSLKDKTLTGILFGTHTLESRKYCLELKISDNPEYIGSSVAIEMGEEKYTLLINPSSYTDLLKNKWLGGRFGEWFKYDIVTIKYAQEDEELSKYLRLAERLNTC